MDVETIKNFCSGRWAETIRKLAPHLTDMIERDRKHGPCSLCGGVDDDSIQ